MQAHVLFYVFNRETSGWGAAHWDVASCSVTSSNQKLVTLPVLCQLLFLLVEGSAWVLVLYRWKSWCCHLLSRLWVLSSCLSNFDQLKHRWLCIKTPCRRFSLLGCTYSTTIMVTTSKGTDTPWLLTPDSTPLVSTFRAPPALQPAQNAQHLLNEWATGSVS